MEFTELFNRIRLKLKAVAIRLSRISINVCADDLFQEASVHLWQRFEEGALNDKSDSYIIQGCVFHLRNYMRKSQKKLQRNSFSMYNKANQYGVTWAEILSDNKSYNLDDNIEARLIKYDVCRRLNAREKNIFSLSLQGLTTREIGEKVGISHVMVIKIGKRIRTKCNDLSREEFFHN